MNALFNFNRSLSTPLLFVLAMNLGACATLDSWLKPIASDGATAISPRRAVPDDDLAEAGLATYPGQEAVAVDESPATVPDGVYYFRNVMSGKCLTFTDPESRTAVPVQKRCNGSAAQSFWVQHRGRFNNYFLKNRESEKFLQIKGLVAADGGSLEQASESSSVAQRFGFDKKTEGQYAIRSLFSGKVLEAKDNQAAEDVVIRQWEYQGHTHQVWQLVLLGTVEPLP